MQISLLLNICYIVFPFKSPSKSIVTLDHLEVWRLLRNRGLWLIYISLVFYTYCSLRHHISRISHPHPQTCRRRNSWYLNTYFIYIPHHGLALRTKARPLHSTRLSGNISLGPKACEGNQQEWVAELQGMNAISVMQKNSKTRAKIRALSGNVAPIRIGMKYRKLSPKLKLSSGNRHRIWIRNDSLKPQ